MRKQQRVWLKEHTTQESIPAMDSTRPSSGVVAFINYAKKHRKLRTGKVIDIGCGKGRNAVYLAELGYSVVATDYIDEALTITKKLAKKRKIADKVSTTNIDIANKWPFQDEYFDLAVDSFSSIDIETFNGRQTYRDEMFRTLKNGGLALVQVVAADDELESEMAKQNPGKEPNSVIWPTNGKFQKNFDELELRKFYCKFKALALKKIKKPAIKLGRTYIASDYWLVLQK